VAPLRKLNLLYFQLNSNCPPNNYRDCCVKVPIAIRSSGKPGGRSKRRTSSALAEDLERKARPRSNFQSVAGEHRGHVHTSIGSVSQIKNKFFDQLNNPNVNICFNNKYVHEKASRTCRIFMAQFVLDRKVAAVTLYTKIEFTKNNNTFPL
jgi:hypothetical protein